AITQCQSGAADPPALRPIGFRPGRDKNQLRWKFAYNHVMISVHELTKRFPLPGGGSLLAVNRVSFSVQPGEVYGLLGPHGADKTTTRRMVLGLLAPTSGQASIAGFTSSSHPDEVKRRVGLVAANAGLYPG